MQQLRHHGVREFHRNEDADAFCAEEISKVGYTVVDSGYSAAELQDIRDRIDRIYALQLQEIGGEGQLKRIDDGRTPPLRDGRSRPEDLGQCLSRRP